MVEALPMKPSPVYAAYPAVKKIVLVLGIDAHRHTTCIICNPGAHHGSAVCCARGILQLACRLVDASGLEWRPAFAASAQRE